ncbi:toxin glutamine deamidase domain-containing protein [Saccharothrix isguenensis]
MEIPDEVKWLLPIVVGESWPEGDEDKLRELRDAWHRAAGAIPQVGSTADRGATSIIGEWTGDSAEAFEAAWGKYVDGDEAYFTSLTEACQALGDSCDATALDVEYTKYMIIASLIMLAISIAAMIASAVVTFGASTAGIVPAQIATRMTVQMIFRQLLQKLMQQGFKKVAQQVLQRVLREVATNVATGVALDAGIQAVQVASGDRKSWDWGKTGDAAVGGAVEGVVGAASNAVPAGATRGMTDSVGGQVADGAVRAATRGAVEGAVTTVGEAAVTGELDQLSAKDVLMGASGGAVDRGVSGATDSLGAVRDLNADTPASPGAGRSTPDTGPGPSRSGGGVDDLPGREASTRTSGLSPSVTDRTDGASLGGQAGAGQAGAGQAGAGQAGAGQAGAGQAGSQTSSQSPASAPASQAWVPPGGTSPSGATPPSSTTPSSSSTAASQTSTQHPAAQHTAGSPPPGSASQPTPSAAPGQGSPAPTGTSPGSAATPGSATNSTAAPSTGTSPGTATSPSSTTGTGTGSNSSTAAGTGTGTGSSPATSTGGYGRAPAPGGGHGTAPPSPGGFGPQPGGYPVDPGRRHPPHGNVFAAGTTGPQFPPRFDTPPPPRHDAPPIPQQHSAPPPPMPGHQPGGTPPRSFNQGPPSRGPQGTPPPRGPVPPPQRSPHGSPPPHGAPPPRADMPPTGRPTPPPYTPAPPPPRTPMPPPARPMGPPPPHRPPIGRAPMPPQGYAPNAPHPQGPPPQRHPGPQPAFPPPNAPRPQGPPPPGPSRPPAGTRPAGQPNPTHTPEPPSPPKTWAPAPVTPPDSARAPEPSTPPEPSRDPERAPAAPHRNPTPAPEPTPDQAHPKPPADQTIDTEPPRTEPDSAEPTSANLDRARLDPAERNHTYPDRTGNDPVDTGAVDTDPVDPDPVDAGPVDAAPAADPVDTDPGQSDPGQADRVDTDLGEDYLFDPDHRATVADTAAIAAGISSDARRLQITRDALAHRDASKSLSRLSDEGAIALHAYTGHDLFASTNTAQRLGPDGKLADDKPVDFQRARHQVRAIVSAINELDPIEAELVRGIDVMGSPVLAKMIADQYVPGRTTVEPTVVSASIKESPDFVSKFGDDVEIHIQAKTARDIHELSQNKDEREAVSKPATQWYTHAKETLEVRQGEHVKQKTIIRVEEVLPGDPRYLDRTAAEQEIADRRAANNANAKTFDALIKEAIRERLEGRKSDQPERSKPAESTITTRLGGGNSSSYAGADPMLDGGPLDVDTTGSHDWSPLSRATNPPSEPAIHADTANANQSAKYVAERHPHLAGVNPRFHEADAFEQGYQTNCTRGVVASALRQSGIDTEAGPLRPDQMESLGTLDHVQEQLGGEWRSHNDYDDVIRAMRDLPVESRAVIAVKYIGPDGVEYGHVAEVVHTREGVAFVDPQTNSLMSLPHPPVKLDLLPYDLAEVADRQAPRADTEASTKDTTAAGDTGYGAAEPNQRSDDRPPPTREEIGRYLQEPRVQEAMRLADAISQRDPDSRIAVDGRKLHIGEAIAALLPRHPEMAALLRDVPFLENSLLARPQTLANLLRHPQAIEVLDDCVREVREHEDGPEVLADHYDAEPAPGPALLTPEQAELSERAQNLADDSPASHRVQPDFIIANQDTGYLAQYLEGLYRDWSVKQGQLHALADEVATATGGEAFSRKTEKSRVRAMDKIAGYKGDAAKLVDLVGSKIQYSTVADAYKGLRILLDKVEQDDSKISVVDFDDRFLTPQKSGYRDLQFNVRLQLADGTSHVAELRLHLKAIDDVADFEHALFEVRRDFKALAKEQGRTMTPEERALTGSILAREQELFGEAFRQGRGTVQDGDR